jgi:hypothetical protein
MSLVTRPYIGSVSERDIDFLLLEELHSEPEFVCWFTSVVTGKPPETIKPLDGKKNSQLNSRLKKWFLRLLSGG